MENLSKALMIAGGVIIGTLVAALFVYEIIHFSNYAQVYHQEAERVRVTKFNSEFEKYAYRSEITAQDVVSLSNYIRCWNENNPFMTVTSTGTVTEENIHTFLKDNQNKYKCKLEYSADDGRVNKVIITVKN